MLASAFNWKIELRARRMYGNKTPCPIDAVLEILCHSMSMLYRLRRKDLLRAAQVAFGCRGGRILLFEDRDRSTQASQV